MADSTVESLQAGGSRDRPADGPTRRPNAPSASGSEEEALAVPPDDRGRRTRAGSSPRRPARSAKAPRRRDCSAMVPRRESAQSSNYWTPELEAVARRTMKQASGYSWMYEKMVAAAKKWGSFLSILAGVLAGVVGTEGLVSIFTSDGETPQWAGVLTAVIGYFIAFVVVLDNTWKLDVVRSEGLVAQVGFAHLSRSVMYQLALRPEGRQDARDFVKGILNEIEALKLSSPTIDGRVKRAYVEKFKDNPIYNPEGQWEDYRFQFRKGWDVSGDEDDGVDGVDGGVGVDGVDGGYAYTDAPGGFDAPGAPPPVAAESPPPSPPKEKQTHRRRGSRGSGDRGPLSRGALGKMLTAYEDACEGRSKADD